MILNGVSAAPLDAATLLAMSSERLTRDLNANQTVTLSNKIQSYLANPAHQKELQTPEGKVLLQLQLKLTNYIALKLHFAKCLKTTSSRLKLDQRILEVYMKAKGMPECDAISQKVLTSQKDLKSVVEGMQKKLERGKNKAILNPRQQSISLRNQVMEQGMRDALNSYLDLEHRFYEKGKSSKVLSARAAFNHLFEPAQGNYSRFTQDLKDNIIKDAERYQESLMKVPRTNTDQLRDHLNRNIRTMQKVYGSVSMKATNSKFVNGEGYTPEIDKEYKNKGGAKAWVQSEMNKNEIHNNKRKSEVKNYNEWTKGYLAELARSPSGQFMFTSAVGKYFAAPLNFESDEVVNFKTIPDLKVVSSAIDEVKKGLGQYGKHLAGMAHSKTWMGATLQTAEIKSQIKDLVVTAPAAIGQVLIKNPEYASLVCEAVNEANSDQVSSDKKQEVYMYGGMIVGGVLLASGIGSAAGATILAGTAAGTVLTAVGTGAAISGTVVGLGSAVYLNERVNQLSESYSKSKAAFFGHRGIDFDAWPEMKKTYEELEEAQFDLAMQMGFSILDIGTLGQLTSSLSKAERLAGLKQAKQFLNIGEYDLARSAKLASISGKLGKEESSKFFTMLSQVSSDQKYIDEILLKASKSSPSELKALMKELEAALKSDGGVSLLRAELDVWAGKTKPIVVTANKPVAIAAYVKDVSNDLKSAGVVHQIEDGKLIVIASNSNHSSLGKLASVAETNGFQIKIDPNLNVSPGKLGKVDSKTGVIYLSKEYANGKSSAELEALTKKIKEGCKL